MSYIKGTYLEELIDRTVDGWAKILGYTDERARNSDGTYKGDDPSTPDVNEAWESGKSPKKKTKKKTRKKVKKNG
tara:strand:- start:322 stop:546 length:225 start_codon:yes stop_codon:yes gene_type:complete